MFNFEDMLNELLNLDEKFEKTKGILLCFDNNSWIFPSQEVIKNKVQAYGFLQREPCRRKVDLNCEVLHSKIFETSIATELSLASSKQVIPNKFRNLKIVKI